MSANILIPPNHEPNATFRGDHTTTHAVNGGTYARVTWTLSVSGRGFVNSVGGVVNEANMATDSDSQTFEITEWVKAGDVIGAGGSATNGSGNVGSQAASTVIGIYEATALKNASLVSRAKCYASASASLALSTGTMDIDTLGEFSATWNVEEYIIQGT